MLKALLMKEKHASENKKFDATLPTELRQEWLTMMQNWECDKSKQNPYTHTEKGIIFYSCVAVPRMFTSPQLAILPRSVRSSLKQMRWPSDETVPRRKC